ncbi:hypothetical protein BaRGS_00002321, partial [Batillaria attramentaria]
MTVASLNAAVEKACHQQQKIHQQRSEGWKRLSGVSCYLAEDCANVHPSTCSSNA